MLEPATDHVDTSPGYWVEPFTPAEAGRLAGRVSNLDRPVFALTGLSQTTRAALFARYSRSPKSLRRLLLDEFLDAAEPGIEPQPGDTDRARALFARVVNEYGDDSVAQLAGVHIACEQASQLLCKAIEWGRLAAYLEQSTRYIAYTDRRDGRYRWYRDPQLMRSPHGARVEAAMDGLFDTYAALLPPLRAHLDQVLPAEPDVRARTRAIRALALDLLRGLLPAGTVSNVGVFASPQALEQLVMRLRAHPLPEAIAYAELIAAELRAQVPDFVARLDREDRGGAWVDYLRDTAASLRQAASELGVAPAAAPAATEGGVVLLDWEPDAEDRVIAAALFPHLGCSEAEARRMVGVIGPQHRAELFRAALGERGNRRHKPGRGFEHATYTFEVVSDYGAFRDLQRHRLLTIQWQELTPALGFTVPAELEAAGLDGHWRAAVERAEQAFLAVREDLPSQAPYLVTLGHRVRYLVRLNAREATHLIELRTAPQGHPSYRRVCLEMHRLIDEVAGHHLIAAAMRFVGSDDVHLPRYAAEARRGG